MKWKWRRKPLYVTLLPLTVVIGLFLTFMACGPKHKDEPDCGFVQNVYGERISWKTTEPISFYVHESFPQEMRPALEAAFKVWEKSLNRVVFKVAEYDYKGPLQPRQDGVNVIYWMDSWEKEKASEQARTSVFWVGSLIKEADIRLNAKNFSFYVDEPKQDKDVHLESLFVHELGHVLGLKHKDDGPSVMATYLSSETVRNKLTDYDRQNLTCEY